MPRVKRGKVRTKKRSKLTKSTKGYTGRRKNVVRLAKETETKAGAYAYRDRRNKKRVNRRLWQIQLGNAVRWHDLSYSKFIDILKKKKIDLDRKVLAQMAKEYPDVFAAFVKEIKK